MNALFFWRISRGARSEHPSPKESFPRGYGLAVTIVGPVAAGKTFLARALGHTACRRGYSVFAVRTDHMLKTLKHARLDHTYTFCKPTRSSS